MAGSVGRRGRAAFLSVMLAGAAFALPAGAEEVYQPINPTMGNQTITLTGKDMTIDQVIAVARYGAKVQISPEAKQREADNYGLLLEAATEASRSTGSTAAPATSARQ